MNKTMYYDCFTLSVVEMMCSDAIAYSKTKQWKCNFDEFKQFFREQLDVATRMLAEGAPSVDIVVERDGSVVLHRNDFPTKYNSTDVVFIYSVRLNTQVLYDVVRYDYRNEVGAQKEVKEDEYCVEYKGTTYVFDSVYEHDLVESMLRLLKHNGYADMSGTDFYYMIKSVFRLLGVGSDWKIRW